MTTLPLPAGDIERDAGVPCFSDADEASTCSQFHSTNGDSFDDQSLSCYDIGRASSATASECSVVAEESCGIQHLDLNSDLRDCRICHSSLNSENNELGVPIELGCSCKHDLAVAHQRCAESWFKIKGNRKLDCQIEMIQSRKEDEGVYDSLVVSVSETDALRICEICKTTAENVGEPNEVRERTSENRNAVVMVIVEPPFPPPPSTPVPLRAPGIRFCNGRRFLNFLLACMVFAFVISWFFRFNVSS